MITEIAVGFSLGTMTILVGLFLGSIIMGLLDGLGARS